MSNIPVLMERTLTASRAAPRSRGLTSTSVVGLVGRSAELELIEALLAGRSRLGHGLLLRGDAGGG
jgi:hypothetical protein